MKSIVIQLANYDELASIKDKMVWWSFRRIILVWPKRGKILSNELDLVLLQRAALSIGSELVLVSHHTYVREWAEALGIPVFNSIPAAEKTKWVATKKGANIAKIPQGLDSMTKKQEKVHDNSRDKFAKPIKRIYAVLLSLIVFIALAALVLVILPGARITYYPAITHQEIEITISASEVFSGINPSGNIPAVMKYVEVSGELSRPSSGKTTIPDKKASGSVTFTNLTSSRVTIPSGTILMTDEIEDTQFLLRDEVILPAGIGNSISGNVEALTAGSGGNIEAGRIVSIGGDLGSKVSASNTNAFTGGTDIETLSPNDNDYVVLEKLLLEDLKKQGLTDLQSGLVQGEVLIEKSLDLDQVLVREQIHKVGEPSDQAMLHMTVRMKALTYQDRDLEALAFLILDANKPDGYQPVENSIFINQTDEITMDNPDRVSWQSKVTRLLVQDWDADLAAQKLAGKKTSEALEIFSSLFTQSKPADVRLFISWWPWMPIMPTRIYFINGAST